MTGRKLDKKAGRQLDKRRNWNRSHVGTTTDPKGIPPSGAFFWSMSESERGDNQGLEETDKGVSNPNLNHPQVFTFQPSFSPSGAERPETKPVVKQTPFTSGFGFPFPHPSRFPSSFTFPPPSTFQPSFSPSNAERPEEKPAAQESSFPSLFTFQQPRQTARATDFVFGAAHREQRGTETTERSGEMNTDIPQNTGNKEEKEHGDQEEPSAANSGGDGHRDKSKRERDVHGGGETTGGSTDRRDLHLQVSQDQDSNTGMCRGEVTGIQENSTDITDDRNGNETGAARHDPAGDQGKGGHQGGVDRAADPQREIVENRGDTQNIAAGETDQHETGTDAASLDKDGSDAEGEWDTEEESTDSADINDTVIENPPKGKPDASSNKGTSTENRRDPAQDGEHDDADVIAGGEGPQAHQVDKDRSADVIAGGEGPQAHQVDKDHSTDIAARKEDPEAEPSHNTIKNNETFENRLSGHTGLDSERRKRTSAQPAVESHPDQEAPQFGKSAAQGRSRQESAATPGIRHGLGPHQYGNESGTPPPSPLSFLTARPTGLNTPETSRGFGRGRGRGRAVTPDSGIASPDVGGQSSPLIREIHTMLSSVLEGQPDRGARRQLLPDYESAAGMHDYFSEIHRKYAAIKELEQKTQQLRGELAKLEGELGEKDKVIGQLQTDREGTRRSAEQERAALQSQLAERDGVITNLERKMNDLKDNIQSLENELKTREDCSGSLATIGNMLASERTRAEQLEREKVELADDMEQLREENRSMQRCLEVHDRTASSLRLQKLLWKAVVSKQNSSLDECRTWQQQLVAELEKERQARSALETDVANSRRDVSQSQATLRVQLDSFARERDDLNSQVEDLTAQLARAQEQAESYRTTTEEQTVAVCHLSEVRTDLEAEIAIMQERAEVAEKKATRHEQDVNTLTLCRDSLQTQKTVAEEYVMELSRQMTPLQVLCCQKQDELDAITASKDARIKELTAQLSEAVRIVMPLKMNAREAKLDAQQARAQMESIQQHVEQYKDEISTGAAALKKAYTLEEQLRSRISEQEDKKKRYLQEKEQSDRQVKLLKDEVERLRRRCQGGDQSQV